MNDELLTPRSLLHLVNCLRHFSWTSCCLPSYWWLVNKVCRVCMFFLLSLRSHTGFPLRVHEKNANQVSLRPKVAPRNVCSGSPWLMDCEACFPAISSMQSGSPRFWNLQICPRRRMRRKQWRQGSMSGVWDVWRNTDSAASEPLFSRIFCTFLCVFSKGVFFSHLLNQTRTGSAITVVHLYSTSKWHKEQYINCVIWIQFSRSPK